MPGNCPSLRLSTPASLSIAWNQNTTQKIPSEHCYDQVGFFCRTHGWQSWPWSVLHGFAQLVLMHTGWLPTLQSWPGSVKTLKQLPRGHEEENTKWVIWKHTNKLMCSCGTNTACGCVLPPCGHLCAAHCLPVNLKCWFCSRWMTATCTNSTFDNQRQRWCKTDLIQAFLIIFMLWVGVAFLLLGLVLAVRAFCPAWERSAHTAVGQIIITTCTVSTLSHTGRSIKTI